MNQWEKLKQRCDFLTAELAQANLDSSKRHTYQKELSQLTDALEKYQEVVSLEKKVEENQGQAAQSSDPEMLELFQEEFKELSEQLKNARTELDDLIYPPDPRDNRSVFLEIRAGTGGQEAALFAADLLRMYTNYGLRKNWRVSVEDSSTTDLGGYREIVLYIAGKNVYGHLKKESGVHRVQRVPATETAGRVHTSTATVAVLPEAEEVDVVINPADLRIDVYRAGGAGGQHVNKTESAVRITHVPTGVVVACQDDRSQHKNKAKAMKILKSRILALQMEQQEAEMSKQRKEQVGAGTRSEKVRTYNFPQNRVTDHQVEVTLNKLDMVIEGYLDEIIDPLMEVARQERKKYSIFANQ